MKVIWLRIALIRCKELNEKKWEEKKKRSAQVTDQNRGREREREDKKKKKNNNIQLSESTTTIYRCPSMSEAHSRIKHSSNHHTRQQDTAIL